MDSFHNKKENTFEILAPAGSKESLCAAVLGKANAVYFGFKSGNARGRADNFSDFEVLKAIEFLRKQNIKSYITLNTVVFENELQALEKKLNLLSLNPPDAIIFQDLSVLELGKQIIPQIEFHASTQLGICNLDGLKIMEQLGVSRAVLARELTFEEIKSLTGKTKVELEVFVFGAMCYSCSGFCYASLIENKRSGNRGVCSQICRTKFNGETPFSLKDLDLFLEVEKLAEIGVKSFKIEGRMKGADYVYNATKALNILKEGNFSKESKIECEKLIESIFLREKGKGYFYNVDNNIFVNKKHSLQKKAGIVIDTKGELIKIKQNKDITLNLGNRIKINNQGSVITGFKNNYFKLSTKINCKNGDLVELFPNKESVKGVKGLTNTLENTKIPVNIQLICNITESKFSIKANFNNNIVFEKEYQINTEISKSGGITAELLKTKFKSPEIKITSIEINKNNFYINPSYFKQINKELTTFFNNKENLIEKYSKSFLDNYSEFKFEFDNEISNNFEILPPVYYEKLDYSKGKALIINNIGQLIFKTKEKIAGKFLPITNKVSANVTKRMGIKKFLKPYELKSEKNTPYFVVRKLPANLPDNFTVKKLKNTFLIYKSK